MRIQGVSGKGLWEVRDEGLEVGMWKSVEEQETVMGEGYVHCSGLAVASKAEDALHAM